MTLPLGTVILMQLYHNPMSTCSQKVRLVLAEKSLDFDSIILDLQQGEQFKPDYLALNPLAVVPTLVDDHQAMIESTLINEYLEERYLGPALTPSTAVERHQVRLFTKVIDDVLHPACGIITYAIGIRPGLLRRSKADITALINAIPDPLRRRDRAQVIAKGVEAENFDAALRAYLTVLDQAEARLNGQPYLTGSSVSLADFALLPYLIRLDQLALYDGIEARPLLSIWYNRMRDRPSYHDAVTAWVSTAAIGAFRAAGEQVRDQLKLG